MTSPAAAPTTVLVCDDDPIVREALAGYLNREDDLEVLAIEETAEAALERIAHHAPDVVLMDLVLPGRDGVDAAAQIVREHPATAVIVLTTFGTEEQARSAIAAGASGFLLKTTPAEALVAAVRAASASVGTVLSPVIAAEIASPSSDAPAEAAAPTPPPALGLTERETEVLAAVCRAASNGEIALELGVTESTVKSHISALNAKLGCRTRIQLAVRAFELGLVPAPGPTGAP